MYARVVITVIKRLLMKSLAILSRRPRVKVSPEKFEGVVVDIGAGGEGIIAKTCGRNAVCVDISKREIDEARSRGAVAQWVLSDARSMPFRNGSFDVATFFFSLMYVKTLERKRAIIGEAKRILKSDGRLYFWEAIIGEKPDLYVVFVDVSLPDGGKVVTGYGVRGKGKEQTLEQVRQLALEVGFKVITPESHKNWFAACFH
jgi:ubiquinone/menaquinone biosynthesis C-methylase UbiE